MDGTERRWNDKAWLLARLVKPGGLLQGLSVWERLISDRRAGGCCVSPGASSMLWALWGTRRVFLPRSALVCRSGWAALPRRLLWVVGAVSRGWGAGWIGNWSGIGQKRWGQANGLWPPLPNPFLWYGLSCKLSNFQNSKINQQVKLIHKSVLLTNWTGW